MNRTLYYSSIVLGACMVAISTLVGYTPAHLYVYAITFLAIITSILNHGSSNPLYKWVDRFVIYVAVIVYIYSSLLIKSPLRKAVALCIIVSMVLLYLYSKYVKHRKSMTTNDTQKIIHLRNS